MSAEINITGIGTLSDPTKYIPVRVTGGSAFDPVTASRLAQTGKSTANAALTVTLPAVAGQFHYITGITITRSSTAALTGTASLDITTTNLGGLAWSVGNAMVAGGTSQDVNFMPAAPHRSTTAGTNSTIVFPAAGAGVLSRITVTYFTAT